MFDEKFIEKAKLIKLMIFDIDGIFTDGRIFVDDNGIEIKAFHVLDGQGIKFLQKSDIQIAIISGRNAKGVKYRMKQLGIQHVYQGHINKLHVYEELLKKFNLQDHEVAMMGDDLPDMPLFKRVGLSITVPNAVKEILEFVPFVTEHKGGKGAVREVCEALLKAKGLWENILTSY